MGSPYKLIVLCDGTWCGREAGTESNIHILARMIGISMTGEPYSLEDHTRRVRARYFNGVGLGSTFFDYLFNGATGSDIGEHCIEVYEYIVQNYTQQDEIWMFGLSRGAYTVRSVAGMINNCGIIRRRATSAETRNLCHEVYKIYRSPHATDAPPSFPNSQIGQFRVNASYPVKTPIRFMGILDTVGSFGFPRLNAWIGLEWPEFYDKEISSEVNSVYHAVSMHDRLWAFQPCLALKNRKHKSVNPPHIHERWFPGAHYDLGRQRFRFLRNSPNIVERLVFWLPKLLSKTVEPNEVLADLVLIWIMEGVQTEDGLGNVIPNIAAEITGRIGRITGGNRRVGLGDIYGNLYKFGPLPNVLDPVFWFANKATLGLSGKVGKALEDFLGIKSIMAILLNVRERRISDITADTYHYNLPDARLGGLTMNNLADLGRYPSQTYERFQLFLLAAGVINAATYHSRVA